MSAISLIAPAANPLHVTLSDSPRPADSVSSFAGQLADVLAKLLGDSKTDSQIEIDVAASPNQNPNARQFTITVKAPTAPATKPAATATTHPVAARPSTDPQAPLLTEDGYPQALLLYGALGRDTAAPPPPPLPKPTSEDAYWSLQPPAVQVLRTLAPEARFDKAQELLQQGYLIDYPIMVLGWGPLKTMLARHNAGYTWVPSFMQTTPQMIPGMSFPGVPVYDPNNPPPRSIPVKFDFAKGTSDGEAITAEYGVKLTEASAT